MTKDKFFESVYLKATLLGLVKRLTPIALIFLIATHTLAQGKTNERQGYLGIAYFQNTPDSLAKKLNYKSGVVVKSVLPNTTAARIGLQANDIIVKVNSAVVSAPAEISTIAKGLLENEKIEVIVFRDKRELKLRGTVSTKPTN
jgi:uncharacterized protein